MSRPFWSVADAEQARVARMNAADDFDVIGRRLQQIKEKTAAWPRSFLRDKVCSWASVPALRTHK